MTIRTGDRGRARPRGAAWARPVGCNSSQESTVKKDSKAVRKLQLHRESLRDLDLGVVAAGSRTDISFVYTGCLTLCNTTH
jgi:hypothetical protein